MENDPDIIACNEAYHTNAKAGHIQPTRENREAYTLGWINGMTYAYKETAKMCRTPEKKRGILAALFGNG